MHRVDLQRAHGTTARYWTGCRCVCCRAASNEYYSCYRAEHRDAIAEDNRRYCTRNPERRKASVHLWSAKNPESQAARVRQYRARKSNTPGIHTAADVAAQYLRQHGRCYWCSKKVGKSYHVDHVVPPGKGGSDGPENIVIACPLCNRKKSDKHPMDFAGRMF